MERTGANIMGTRMFEQGEVAWPDELETPWRQWCSAGGDAFSRPCGERWAEVHRRLV